MDAAGVAIGGPEVGTRFDEAAHELVQIEVEVFVGCGKLAFQKAHIGALLPALAGGEIDEGVEIAKPQGEGGDEPGVEPEIRKGGGDRRRDLCGEEFAVNAQGFIRHVADVAEFIVHAGKQFGEVVFGRVGGENTVHHDCGPLKQCAGEPLGRAAARRRIGPRGVECLSLGDVVFEGAEAAGDTDDGVNGGGIGGVRPQYGDGAIHIEFGCEVFIHWCWLVGFAER